MKPLWRDSKRLELRLGLLTSTVADAILPAISRFIAALKESTFLVQIVFGKRSVVPQVLVIIHLALFVLLLLLLFLARKATSGRHSLQVMTVHLLVHQGVDIFIYEASGRVYRR